MDIIEASVLAIAIAILIVGVLASIAVVASIIFVLRRLDVGGTKKEESKQNHGAPTPNDKGDDQPGG